MRFIIPLKNVLLIALALSIALRGRGGQQDAPAGAVRVEIMALQENLWVEIQHNRVDQGS